MKRLGAEGGGGHYLPVLRVTVRYIRYILRFRTTIATIGPQDHIGCWCAYLLLSHEPHFRDSKTLPEVFSQV